MKDKTLVINGFSKAYAMTGWRLGYACGHPDLIGAMYKVHQYAIMSAPTTAQYAAVEALRNSDDDITAMVREYNRRRRTMLDGFRKAGLNCFEPFGAFYVFPDITSSGLGSNEFCERLLQEEKVAVVPGTAFGPSGEGHVRMAYAVGFDTIHKAIDGIGRFLKRL
jgi:aminotransferase